MRAATRGAGVQDADTDHTGVTKFRTLTRGTHVAMHAAMRRRVIIDSNHRPATIPDECEPNPITQEIEIDCIHCRALRARDEHREVVVPSNRERR